MASLKPAKTEKEKKLNSLISFATNLSDTIKTDPLDATLTSQIEKHLKGSFPISKAFTTATRSEQLDKLGTNLWNIATRLRRDNDETDKKALCSLRVFAFFLLVGAQRPSSEPSPESFRNEIRLLKVSLKGAKFCLDHKQIDLCQEVLERAAVLEEELAKDQSQADSDDVEVCARLTAEYWVLRTALVWKQSRLDLTEVMFRKASLNKTRLDPATAEKFADLLYEIGKDQLRKKEFEIAVRWLERSYDILAEQDLEKLSSDAGELRLSIMHGLVRALLGLQNDGARSKAWDLVNLLDSDFGDKLVVSLLKLELLSSESEFRAEDYYNVLARMIRAIVLTESNFKTPDLACKMLDNFLTTRLFGSENDDWIEKTSITRLWIATSLPEATDALASLLQLIESISQEYGKCFTPPATHAAQTLLWKRIESEYAKGQFDIAEAWCRLARHQLFEKAGELNKSKISRKIILCALGRQDVASAREAFYQMPESGKAAPLTRYLMYKVALRDGDPDLAAECLDAVCNGSAKDSTLLFACILEAQQSGEKRQAVAALQKVLEKYSYDAPAGVHLPALLRCTARLLVSELVAGSANDEMSITEICKLFEGAAAQAKSPKRRAPAQSNQGFNIVELQWFSRNSYNLCLKYCSEIHPGTLIRLLRSCIQFAELLQKDFPHDPSDDPALRLLFCHFLAASACIVLARAEDNIELSLQHYLAVRKHVQHYRTLLQVQMDLESLGSPAKADLKTKEFELLKFELEALVHLAAWDDMDAVFEACLDMDNVAHWEALADLVIVVHTEILKAGLGAEYQAKIPAVLQKIINLTWRSSGNDIVKLARWLRCLFQMALSFDVTISLHCLDQAIDFTRRYQSTSTPYPTEELEWLAATAFNRGVDLYCASDNAGCKLWAEKSLAVAAVAEDGGLLHRTLQAKYSRLSWVDV
ncbi:meiosis protein SPO22/ZIP4 like-domain-containing protein [Cryomyces antarcticus]